MPANLRFPVSCRLKSPVSYIWGMTDSPFPAAEFRAAAETYDELGPAYGYAVAESFVDRIGRQTDARVDVRLAEVVAWPPEPVPGPPLSAPTQAAPPRPAAEPKQLSVVGLALGSICLGVPLSAIAVAVGSPPAGIRGLLVVWAAITAINIGYAVRLRSPQNRRWPRAGAVWRSAGAVWPQGRAAWWPLPALGGRPQMAVPEREAERVSRHWVSSPPRTSSAVSA